MRAPVLESLACANARICTVEEMNKSADALVVLCADCIGAEVRGSYDSSDASIRLLHRMLTSIDTSLLFRDPFHPRSLEEAIAHVGDAMVRARRWEESR